MYRHAFTLFFALFLIGCVDGEKGKNNSNSTVETSPKIEYLENNLSEKSETYKSKNSINPPLEDSIKVNRSLVDFLMNPIDLQEFKIKKGQANSGGFPFKDHLYRPSYQGLFIRFYIFPKFGENGPRLVVYRKGKEFGEFFEDRDTLIQLFSNRPDNDLKNADLVLKNLDEIEDSFGDSYLKDGEYIFYVDNNIKTVLTICASENRKVKWFKVTRLNKIINSINDIPESLRNIDAS